MLNQTNLAVDSRKNVSGLLDFNLNNNNPQIKLNRMRKLFPDFYDNYDYDSMQSNNRTPVSQALQIFGLSSSDYDTGLIFDNGSSLLSDYSTENDTISSSQLISQLSTPLIYILFMLLIYSSIILVVFMSAVYTHRKRVGYNYDESFEEFTNQDSESLCEIKDPKEYDYENEVYLETEKKCLGKNRIFKKQFSANAVESSQNSTGKSYESESTGNEDDSEVEFDGNEELNDFTKELSVYKHPKANNQNDYSYMRMDQCNSNEEQIKNSNYELIKDDSNNSLDKKTTLSAYIKALLKSKSSNSDYKPASKIKKLDLTKYKNTERRRDDQSESKFTLSSITSVNETQFMLDDLKSNNTASLNYNLGIQPLLNLNTSFLNEN